MKILVTGGAGFIGRNLVSNLLENHSVTIYDNLENSSEDSIAEWVDSGAEFVRGDILDYDSLAESCKNHDVMIHLAAKSDVSESIQNPDKTNRVNVAGTVNVTKACIANKIKKIIFASSAAVYGECKDLPVTEASQTEPVSPYGKSKLAAESEIKKIAQYKLDYVILRIFNVYGRGQNEKNMGVIAKFTQSISNQEPLVIYGDGSKTRDFVSICDVVNAFVKSITQKSGTYNIASGTKCTIKQLAEIMSEVSEKNPEIIYKPEKKGDIQDSYADITLAKKELGFVPHSTLRDDIAKLL